MLEEALKRKLSKRNKKKGDDSTDLAAAMHDSAGNPKDGPMQGMIATSAESRETGVRDPSADEADAEAKSTENMTSSPPLTFQPTSGAGVAQDEADHAVQRDTPTLVKTPHIMDSVDLLPLSVFAVLLRQLNHESLECALLACKDEAMLMTVLSWGWDGDSGFEGEGWLRGEGGG